MTYKGIRGHIIQPLSFTTFWHRRITEASMFVSGLVITLYFLPYFTSPGVISSSLVISMPGLIAAMITFAYSFVTYLWPPKKALFIGSFVAYILLFITTSLLIYDTAGLQSSFIALWMILSLFACIFGLWGIIPVVVAALGYGIYLSINDLLTPTSLFNLAIITIVPLVAGYIIFHKQRTKTTTPDNLHELASELSQTANKAEIVLSAISEGVIALNSKGTIELMNPAAQHIIGWGTADAVGLDYRSVLKLSDKASQALTEANDPIREVLATNHDVQTEQFYATTESGKRIVLSLVVSPIGQLGQGVIVVFRDITREQAEEREQAEFISTASHEMRTPVASIEGYLGLALNPQTAQVDAKARDFIEKAQGAAKHLGRLFQDLLDISRAEDGRLPNHPSIVDVIDFTGDIAEGLRPKAEEKKLRLFFKPGTGESGGRELSISPVFYANVDNDHLREVLANLIENAIKYTPEGDVIIDVKGDDEHVTVSIQDSGIGIPREDIPHLFQKFYRVDNTATREIGGTGLGLYLCRRLTEMMGGRIWVESEFGKGSTFNLEIPRTSREEATRLIDAATSGELNPETAIKLDSRATLDTGETSEATNISTTLEEPPAPIPQPAAAPPVPVSLPTVPQPTPPSSPAAVQQVPQPASAANSMQQAPTLSAIEANPAAYVASAPRQPAIKIPVRNPNQPNQP